MRSVEDLNAVSRPFAVMRRLFWRGQDDAALGAQLVQEDAPDGLVGITGSAERSRQVIGRYQQQIGIAGTKLVP